MSVVVWDGQTLAGDRYAQHGELRYQRVKVFQLGPDLFAGFVGTIQGWWIAKEFLEGKISKPDYKVADFSSLIVRRRYGIVEVTTMDEDFIEIPVNMNRYAIGAGREFALGSLYSGHDAKFATNVACDLCATCEGPIDAFEVSDDLPF